MANLRLPGLSPVLLDHGVMGTCIRVGVRRDIHLNVVPRI